MISIILPWRGNPEDLYRTMDELDAPGVEIVVVFDGESEEFKRFESGIYEADVKKVLSPSRREFVAAVNLGMKSATGNLLMIWATDCRINNRYWHEEMKASYEQHFPKGGGLLCANDGYWVGKIAIHPIVDRAFVEWVGYEDGAVLFPGYIHYGSDNELTEIAVAAGKYAYDRSLTYGHPPPPHRVGCDSTTYKGHDGELLKARRASGWKRKSL